MVKKVHMVVIKSNKILLQSSSVMVCYFVYSILVPFKIVVNKENVEIAHKTLKFQIPLRYERSGNLKSYSGMMVINRN